MTQGKLPNPFDTRAVAAWRQAQAAAAAQTPPAQPGGATAATALPPADQARAVMDMWANDGLETFLEAMAAVSAYLEDMASGVATADLDQAVQAAKTGKIVDNAGKALYNAGRQRLWHSVGVTGKLTTPGGTTFEFRKPPAMTRSVSYKRLQADFPEAYSACVTEKKTPADAPARLYLK